MGGNQQPGIDVAEHVGAATGESIEAKRVVPYYWNGTSLQRFSAGASSASTVTSVNDTASSTTLLAANPLRKEAIIVNDSSSILYVKEGTTASSTSYTMKLYTDDTFITQYTGQIDGIWSSDSTGAARITELT